MSLLDEALEGAAANTGPQCGVGAWLDSLDEATRADVNEVIASRAPKLTGPYVHQFLTDRFGVLPFRSETFVRHRRAVRDKRGGCLCPAL